MFSPLILIVFLAHEGVTQPGVWRAWQRAMADHFEIRYHIICPDKPHYGKSFCNTFRLTRMGPTAWGSFSVVYETIRALCQLRSDYSQEDWKKVSRLFIVSGYDIPIHDLRAFDITKDDREIIGKIALPSAGKFAHLQWMCITPQLVNHLYDRYHKQDLFILKLFHECLGMLKTYPDLAPDEIWLNFVGVDARRFSARHILLPFFHDSSRPISPITWKDLHLKEYVQQGPIGLRFNLLQAIFLSRREEICFFRKVHTRVHFPPKLLKMLFDKDIPTPIVHLYRTDLPLNVPQIT